MRLFFKADFVLPGGNSPVKNRNKSRKVKWSLIKKNDEKPVLNP